MTGPTTVSGLVTDSASMSMLVDGTTARDRGSEERRRKGWPAGSAFRPGRGTAYMPSGNRAHSATGSCPPASAAADVGETIRAVAIPAMTRIARRKWAAVTGIGASQCDRASYCAAPRCGSPARDERQDRPWRMAWSLRSIPEISVMRSSRAQTSSGECRAVPSRRRDIRLLLERTTGRSAEVGSVVKVVLSGESQSQAVRLSAYGRSASVAWMMASGPPHQRPRRFRTERSFSGRGPNADVERAQDQSRRTSGFLQAQDAGYNRTDADRQIGVAAPPGPDQSCSQTVRRPTAALIPGATGIAAVGSPRSRRRARPGTQRQGRGGATRCDQR